jgi:hypothetical protein
MRHEVNQIKADLKKTKGVKTQIELPKDMHNRISQLALNDKRRSGERVTNRDKILEAILSGVEVLEVREREQE